MSTPQQPELARSGRGATTPASAKGRAATALPPEDPPRHIPDENRPGHRPKQDQDKPDRPPDAYRVPATRFRFRFDPRLIPLEVPFGITPFTAAIELDTDELRVRFGPWSVSTPWTNVAGVEATGPYSWVKVIGPPRLSLADRGLTFATNAERGVCIRFHQPVTGLDPLGRLRHPALTVTPERVDDLVEALTQRIEAPPEGSQPAQAGQ